MSTVLVQTLFLVLFTTYIIVSQRKVTATRLQERMAQQLDHISRACSKFLARGDIESIHDFLELSRNGTTVDVARLTDTQGATLAVTGNGVNYPLDAEERDMLSQVKAPRVFETKKHQMEAVEPSYGWPPILPSHPARSAPSFASASRTAGLPFWPICSPSS